MKYIMKDSEVYSCWNCSAVCQPDDSEIMVAEKFDITTGDTRMYKYFNCPHCGRIIGIGLTMADMSCKRLGHMVEDKKGWWQKW